MAKKKNEEKSEEQKQSFLSNIASVFLKEAEYNGFLVEDIAELAIGFARVMVNVSYLADMPNEMSDEEKIKAAENATLFYMAYYGRECEKRLRKKGMSYGEAKKGINKVIAKHKKKVVKDK